MSFRNALAGAAAAALGVRQRQQYERDRNEQKALAEWGQAMDILPRLRAEEQAQWDREDEPLVAQSRIPGLSPEAYQTIMGQLAQRRSGRQSQYQIGPLLDRAPGRLREMFRGMGMGAPMQQGVPASPVQLGPRDFLLNKNDEQQYESDIDVLRRAQIADPNASQEYGGEISRLASQQAQRVPYTEGVMRPGAPLTYTSADTQASIPVPGAFGVAPTTQVNIPGQTIEGVGPVQPERGGASIIKAPAVSKADLAQFTREMAAIESLGNKLMADPESRMAFAQIAATKPAVPRTAEDLANARKWLAAARAGIAGLETDAQNRNRYREQDRYGRTAASALTRIKQGVGEPAQLVADAMTLANAIKKAQELGYDTGIQIADDIDPTPRIRADGTEESADEVAARLLSSVAARQANTPEQKRQRARQIEAAHAKLWNLITKPNLSDASVQEYASQLSALTDAAQEEGIVLPRLPVPPQWKIPPGLQFSIDRWNQVGKRTAESRLKKLDQDIEESAILLKELPGKLQQEFEQRKLRLEKERDSKARGWLSRAESAKGEFSEVEKLKKEADARISMGMRAYQDALLLRRSIAQKNDIDPKALAAATDAVNRTRAELDAIIMRYLRPGMSVADLRMRDEAATQSAAPKADPTTASRKMRRAQFIANARKDGMSQQEAEAAANAWERSGRSSWGR